MFFLAILLPIVQNFSLLLQQFIPIHVAFVGDVMLGSRVGDAIRMYGQDYVFSGTRAVLQSHDMVVLNLETSVTRTGVKQRKTYTFAADPEVLSGLRSRNKHVIASVANNHVGDWGQTGFLFTLQHLTEAAIAYVGGGRNEAEAYEPLLVEVKKSLPASVGDFFFHKYFTKSTTSFSFFRTILSLVSKKEYFLTSIAFLAQTCVHPLSFAASGSRPGHAWFHTGYLRDGIKQARMAGADFVFFLAHCGREYTDRPTKQQRDMYRFAIDNGVDAVVGHHPHWYQPIEIYKGKPIFYSLGNYVFDIFRGRRTQQSFIVSLTLLNKKIKKLELIPIVIDGFGSTRLAREHEKKQILTDMYRLSKKYQDLPQLLSGWIWFE